MKQLPSLQQMGCRDKAVLSLSRSLLPARSRALSQSSEPYTLLAPTQPKLEMTPVTLPFRVWLNSQDLLINMRYPFNISCQTYV